jgi:DNA transformation protein and related proteins
LITLAHGRFILLMKIKTEFADYIVESLSTLNGEIYSKRMFGGFGIFCNNQMFAIIANDELYFKTNETLSEEYKKQDLAPFTYMRKDKEISLSYFQAPESILDDQAALSSWAKRSIEIL